MSIKAEGSISPNPMSKTCESVMRMFWLMTF